MTTPPAPDPDDDGLGPLCAEPVSVYPPYTHAPGYRLNSTDRYLALLQALGTGIELGSYDAEVLGWLSREPVGPVGAVCSLLHRARAAARREGNPHP